MPTRRPRPVGGGDRVGEEGDLDPVEHHCRDRTPAPPLPVRHPRGPGARDHHRHRRRPSPRTVPSSSPPTAHELTASRRDRQHRDGRPASRCSSSTASARYTTQDLLDAEQRLLDHAQQPPATASPPGRLSDARWLSSNATTSPSTPANEPSSPRSPPTHDASSSVSGPPAPARPPPCRPSPTPGAPPAAGSSPSPRPRPPREVLGHELGCRAENLHKFQPHPRPPSTPTVADAEPMTPGSSSQPGDLVLVDEAGMAGTRNLDWLTTYARERGAVVRLLGDPAQLASVEAGGALRLLAHDTGAVELTDLHRFTDPDEAAATIGLREGRPDALDFYTGHDRITLRHPRRHARSRLRRLGPRHPPRPHQPAHRRAAAPSPPSTPAPASNASQPASRSQDGVDLHDGTRAGVGDHIVTRRNHRHLASRDGHVRQERRHLDRHAATATATSPSTRHARRAAARSGSPRLRRRARRARLRHHHRPSPRPHRRHRPRPRRRPHTREALYVAATRGTPARPGSTSKTRRSSGSTPNGHPAPPRERPMSWR